MTDYRCVSLCVCEYSYTLYRGRKIDGSLFEPGPDMHVCIYFFRFLM